MFVHFTWWCRHSNKTSIGKIELSFQYIFEQFLALLSRRGAAVDIDTCNVLHWDSRSRMVSPSQRKALDLLQLVKGWSEPAAIDAREERQACPQDRRVSPPATASVLCKGGSFHKSYFQLEECNVPPIRSVKKVDCEKSEEPAESALQCFSGWPAQQLPPTVVFFLHFCRNNLMLHRLDRSLGTIEKWKCWLNCLTTITSNSGRHLLGTRSKDCVLNRRRPTTLPLPAVVAPVKGGVLRRRWSFWRSFTDQRFFP